MSEDTAAAPPAALVDVTSLQCQQCGAGLQLRRLDKTVTCPWCQSSNVVQRPPRQGIPPPSFVVGFARPEDEVRRLVARWGHHAPWYAPGGFKHPQVELLKPVYLPAYLFTGEAEVRWTARAGYTYTKQEKNKSVTATEWHDVAGRARLRLPDLLVSASHQVKNPELEQIEPFDLGRLAAYSDAAVAGWPAEEAARTPGAVTEEYEREATVYLQRRVAQLVPGEKKGEPRVAWTPAGQSADLVLVPVWTMLVRYSPTRPRVRVLVNGQTGKVWGKVPISAPKVTAAVLAVLAFLAGLAWFLKHGGLR